MIPFITPRKFLMIVYIRVIINKHIVVWPEHRTPILMSQELELLNCSIVCAKRNTSNIVERLSRN